MDVYVEPSFKISIVGKISPTYLLSSICLLYPTTKLFDRVGARMEFSSRATDRVLSCIKYPVFSGDMASALFVLFPFPAVLLLLLSLTLVFVAQRIDPHFEEVLVARAPGCERIAGA